MKKQMLSAALVALLAMPALAQNLAVVNGKPVPSSRVKALQQQIEASGRPVTPEVLAQIKEELIAREVFMQEARKRGLDASDEYKRTPCCVATSAARPGFSSTNPANRSPQRSRRMRTWCTPRPPAPTTPMRGASLLEKARDSGVMVVVLRIRRLAGSLR